MITAIAMQADAFSAAEDVIERVRRGDTDALAELISHYQHRLFRFLVRLVRDEPAAEDIFQQTWIRVMEKIRRYDSRHSFDTWLFTVARNLAIDQLRRRRDRSLDAPDDTGRLMTDRLATEMQNPLEHIVDCERGEIIAAAISRLPVIHREVLVLRFEEEMKLEEISEVAGIPLSTVKSRLYRALARAAHHAGETMSEHKISPDTLAIAACGALADEEWRRVERHVAACESCKREMERWIAFTAGLRTLPQPRVPAGLADRSHTRTLRELADASERRRTNLMLCASAGFGWASSLAIAVLVREVAGGGAEMLGWSAAWTAMTWVTAGVAGVLLGAGRGQRRTL